MIRTLLIDNYDSYTFNLYQLIAKVNGIAPLVISHDRENWSRLQQLEFDNVVISPGPGHPANPRDFGLCDRVIQAIEKPILGVCLGHQGIGHLLGARITQGPQVWHGQLSPIQHHNSGLFAGIPSPFIAVQYHSLVLDRYQFPTCLEITAWTEAGLIMGLQHRHKDIFGVQFHPESICTKYGDRLFKNFQAITLSHQTQRSPLTLQSSISPAIPLQAPKIIVKNPESKFRVFDQKLDIFPDPEQVFVQLYGDCPYAFWLDSSQVESGLSRFSFMGDDRGRHSLRVTYRSQNKILEIHQDDQIKYQNISIFDYLKTQLDQRSCFNLSLPFDFNCGFVGYLGYELKSELGSPNRHGSALPDAAFILASQIIVFDHQEQRVYLLYLGHQEEWDQAQIWFETIKESLGTLLPLPDLKPAPGPTPLEFNLCRSRLTYLQDIDYCFKQIRQGETYEVCLTNQLHAQISVDPLQFYRQLRHRNPAPYAGFLRFGDFAIACSSPERFLKLDRQGWIETKPIKGTAPRGQTPSQDQQLSSHLGQSDKERAENLMVLDLCRNDLGRVCEVGTVQVPQLMQVETYATVHQLVSTIRGRLKPETTIIDCIRAAFPGGSMTGAPKLRTMEIIDRLETEARGIYSGSIGFLALNGTADLNIVIRTAVVTSNHVSIGIGGGIVASSEPESEFAETLLKAQALMDAVVAMVHGQVKSELYRISSL
jgi:para-aminobenzoate synthetase